MKRICLESEIGADGVLELRIPVGTSEARRKVLVTIEPMENPDIEAFRTMDWHEFVERTAGSCEGLGLEEPEDLPPQQREWDQ